jgi:hypothetical protein
MEASNLRFPGKPIATGMGPPAMGSRSARGFEIDIEEDS